MWRFPRSCGYPQIIHIFILVGGFNPSEKYDFVSWDDDISDIWKNIKMFQTTNQLCSFTGNVPTKNTVCWIQAPQTGLFHCELRIFVVSCGVAIRVSDGQNKRGSRNHSRPFCHWFLDTCPIPNPIPHVWSLHLASTPFNPHIFWKHILHHEVWNGWTSY